MPHPVLSDASKLAPSFIRGNVSTYCISQWRQRSTMITIIISHWIFNQFLSCLLCYKKQTHFYEKGYVVQLKMQVFHTKILHLM